MTRYFWKGAFDRVHATANAAIAHFTRDGLFRVSPDGINEGTIPLASTEVVTAAKTLTPAENGKTILYAALNSAPITLPRANKGKMKFTISLHALPTTGTGAKIAPQATDKIIGCGLIGTAGQNLGNAVAADALGDYVELISNGVDTWHLLHKLGTWTLALARAAEDGDEDAPVKRRGAKADKADDEDDKAPPKRK